MSLQAKLDARRTAFERKAPKQVLETMHRAQSDLQRSGILGKAIAVGDFAPDFSLTNTAQKPVHLKSLLASGPVVLGFYRGRW